MNAHCDACVGDGVSEEMLEAADRRVYLPMYGFTDSFNLSVAMALLVQRLFYLCPEVLPVGVGLSILERRI